VTERSREVHQARHGRADRSDDHHRHGGHSLHGHTHSHDGDNGPMGRRGLVGMGVAGGLVPSPSALIVLLGAIALGRTWYGIVLVIAYGIGMATTLTAAGLSLVVLSRKLDPAALSAEQSYRRPATVMYIPLGCGVERCPKVPRVSGRR
jgi:nickel/cobalt exporter